MAENGRDSGSLDFGSHGTDASLLEPYLYLSEVSGKDVRGELIDSFQVCYLILKLASTDFFRVSSLSLTAS